MWLILCRSTGKSGNFLYHLHVFMLQGWLIPIVGLCLYLPDSGIRRYTKWWTKLTLFTERNEQLMLRRLATYATLILVTLVLAELFHPLAAIRSLAQGGCRTFPETGKTVCGKFLVYWDAHGGLAQQGFPLSNEFQE